MNETMPPLPIRFYGDPVLREKAAPIDKIDERHRRLAADMAETMYEARGIGLAANQVGLLDRIVVVDVDWADDKEDGDARRPVAMINPEIVDESVEDESASEGCLSIPAVDGDVWRPLRVRCRYLDLDGKTVEIDAEGLRARCILHEIDHLNGVLFIDHLTPSDREKIAGKLAAIREKNPASGPADNAP
jgi:peptide deformylase